jgi:hypothetical protein
MASFAQVEQMARDNRTVIDAIQLNTKEPSALNSAQRKLLTDALYPSGVALHYLNTDVKVNDLVYGSGNVSINGGGFFFAKVVSMPVNADANLDFTYQI